MLFSKVSTHMKRRGERLLSGDLGSLAGDFVYPLPIYMPTKRLVLRDPTETLALSALVRSALQTRGVTALQPRVTAIDLPRGGRFRAWVDWHELAASVDGTRVSKATYFMTSSAFGLKIEMVAYGCVPVPEICEQVAEFALSA